MPGFDSGHNDRHEWKEQGSLDQLGLLKKKCLDKWAILGPKMAYPHNSGSTLRIFLKFCTMNRANSWIKVIIMVCTKKFVQNKWTILGPKMAYPHNSGSALRIFKKFSRMKGAVRYMKFSLVIFAEKVSFGAI